MASHRRSSQHWGVGMLAVVLALAAGVSAADEVAFHFGDFMAGAWSGWQRAANKDTVTPLQLNFTVDGSDLDRLPGVWSDVDSDGMTTPRLDLRVVCDTNTTGVLESASVDDFSEMTTLLEFSFERVSFKHLVSVGSYAPDATYVMHITQPNDFTLSVFNVNHELQHSMAATRLKKKEPKSFLKRWGPMLTIGALFLVQVVLKSYCRGYMDKQRAAGLKAVREREAAAKKDT